MVETALAMQPLLNNALKGDNLDKVVYDRCFYWRCWPAIQILSISIFSTYLKEEEVSFGRRGTVSRGLADAPGIFQAELNKRHAEGANRDVEAAREAGHIQEETGKMLVMGKVFEHVAFHN